MADSRSAIEAIRQRINITDLVSEYVALKRAGKNHKGLCPFHSEKTPSFTVSEEFQTWHCFGCGEHGDLFSFLMKAENLTFPEALERLAKRAGVELEQDRRKPMGRRELLGKLNAAAAAYYSALLKRTPVALEYLRSRKLSDETIDRFRLGYAPPAWDGLVRHLTAKGVDLREASQAGLLIQGERGPYDRFRHRVMFPIFDIQERVIGFGGRALGDDQAKYINSPETPLFSKTRSLYGLNHARKAISDKDCAIVVEGYMDVIAAHQSEFENCVATLGTALTLEHINVLSRYTKRIVLAYDSDSAGMEAALRGAAMFHEAECDVRIARLPAAEDPDSLLRKGQTSAFEALTAEALPITEYRLALLREQVDLSTSGGQAEFLKQAAKVLADVPLFTERERHIKELVRYHPNWQMGLTRAQSQIRNDVERLLRRRQGKVESTAERPESRPPSAVDRAEAAVLGIVLRGEEVAGAVVESLGTDEFSTERTRSAAKLLFDRHRRGGGTPLPELLSEADPETGAFLSELALADSGPPVNEEALRDYIALIKNLEVRGKKAADILGPYIKEGRIDAGANPQEDLREYLEKSGKLPPDNGR